MSPARPARRMRTALVVALGASVLVHAALVGVLVRVTLFPGRSERLVDAPSMLTLAPPNAPPIAEPAPPSPEPPAPDPIPEPDPVPEPVSTPVQDPEPEPLAPPPAAPTGLVIETPIAPRPEPAPTPRQESKPAPEPRPAREPVAPAPVEPPRGVVFAGEAAKAAGHVVYLIDGSGAMVTTLEFVRREVAASIGRLAPSQKFDVIVFRESGADRFPDAGLATPQRKARVGTWLATIEPEGRSDPLVGLKAAADLDPELVFVLTRSIRRSQGSKWGVGREATLAAMETLNPRRGDQRRFVVKVIQFLDPDPTGLLPELANTHGDGPGSYRIIRREDLR